MRGDDRVRLEAIAGDPQAVARFLSLVVKGDKHWLYPVTPNCGYGRFSHAGLSLATHRLAYHLCVGPIPPGKEVHHKCRITNCCNPDCLEALTPGEHRAAHAGDTKNLRRPHPLYRLSPAKRLGAGGRPYSVGNRARKDKAA